MVTTEVNIAVDESQLFRACSQGYVEAFQGTFDTGLQCDVVSKEMVDAVDITLCEGVSPNWKVAITDQVKVASFDGSADANLMKAIRE